MYKQSFSFLFILIALIGHGQVSISNSELYNEPSDAIKKHVKLYLEEAEDGNELAVLFEIIKVEREYFMPCFDSIPTIHPLNPKNEKRISDGFGDRFHPIDKRTNHISG